jgi:uncharacterized membrane protein YeiB
VNLSNCHLISILNLWMHNWLFVVVCLFLLLLEEKSRSQQKVNTPIGLSQQTPQHAGHTLQEMARRAALARHTATSPASPVCVAACLSYILVFMIIVLQFHLTPPRRLTKQLNPLLVNDNSSDSEYQHDSQDEQDEDEVDDERRNKRTHVSST